MEYKGNIIDFHWHLTLHPRHIESCMKRHNISTIIGMPLNFGGLRWDQVLECVGLNEKPKHFQERYLLTINDINYTCYEKYKECDFIEFVPIISGDLSLDKNEERLNEMMGAEWFKQAKVIKFIPIFDHVTSNYYCDLQNVIQIMKKKNIMIHTGWGSTIEPLEKIIERLDGGVNKPNIILAHMKEDFDSYNTLRKRILKNYDFVYLEMSYLSSPKRLNHYVDLGYEDKILFGSDYRMPEDEVSLEWFLNAVKLCKLDTEVEEKILCKNAQKLL